MPVKLDRRDLLKGGVAGLGLLSCPLGIACDDEPRNPSADSGPADASPPDQRITGGDQQILDASSKDGATGGQDATSAPDMAAGTDAQAGQDASPAVAVDIRSTAGIEVTGGGGLSRSNAAYTAKVIADFPTWVDDKHFFYRLQIQQGANAWGVVNEFTPAGDSGTTLVPTGRCGVLWCSGSGPGQITVDGQTTASIAPSATHDQVEAALAQLPSVGSTNNVECGGNLKDGLFLKFKGAMKHQSPKLAISGTGWHLRTFFIWPNFAVNMHDGLKSSEPVTNLAYLANRTGNPWSSFESVCDYLVPYFPRMTICLMHEAVTGFGPFGVYHGNLPTGYQQATGAQYADAFRSQATWMKARQAALNPTSTIEFDFNLWIAPWQPSDTPGIWKQAYPGNDVVDTVSSDPYPGYHSVSNRDKMIDRLSNWKTPFAIANGRKTALQEYAIGNNRLGDFSNDNDHGYGELLYKWWAAECQAGRASYSCYFDAPGSAPDDFTFDGRRHGIPLPKCRQLFLTTFG